MASYRRATKGLISALSGAPLTTIKTGRAPGEVINQIHPLILRAAAYRIPLIKIWGRFSLDIQNITITFCLDLWTLILIFY